MPRTMCTGWAAPAGGREGHAFTMVTREEAKYVRAIEALIKKEIPYFDIGTVE